MKYSFNNGIIYFGILRIIVQRIVRKVDYTLFYCVFTFLFKEGYNMEFYMKLPRNKKEFALFMAIVSVISVNIIAPLITCFEVGFSLAVWKDVLTVIPFIWLSVVALVLITYIPAEKMTAAITNENDSFNSKIIVNVLCTVLMMSVFLTVIGTWIGTRSISLEPIKFFFHKWPRNFAISFAVELIIAQPIARFVLYKKHIAQDKKNSSEQYAA